MGNKVTITWVEETDSTQDEVRRHIREYANMSVVAALYQTAGRGQRGNKWHSGKGENLTFSMLALFGKDGFPPIPASRQFDLTKAATLGVAGYLETKGIECSIKWPNDIYVRNKKICGMLIENVLEDGFVGSSIIGIGLNVNQKDFPPGLVNPTSMSMSTGKTYDIREELEKLSASLEEWFGKFFDQSRPDGIDGFYEDRLYRKGVTCEYVLCSDGSVFEGTIIGVSPDGKLLLKKKNGELNQFAFKEISYII